MMDRAPTAEAASIGHYYITSTKELTGTINKVFTFKFKQLHKQGKYIIFYDAKNLDIVLHIKLINGFS